MDEYIREKNHRYIKFRVEDFFENVRYAREPHSRAKNKKTEDMDLNSTQ